jgi:hypothetical protein
MRKIFASLLLVLLPLMFAWTTAKAYCTHDEPVRSAGHFGHHADEHDHNFNADLPDSGLGKLAHADHHHASVWGLLHAPTALTLQLAPSSAHTEIITHAPAAPPSRIERPKWLRLV